jgi:hypothetical protein
MKLIPLLLALTATAALAQTAARPVLKNISGNTLTEALATGSKTLTISAAGTLTWTSGATLSGASDFRTAAGLTLSAGGLGASDAGKVAIYDPVTANLSTTGSIMVVNGTDPDVFSYLSTTEAAWLYQDYLLRLQMPNTATANRTWKLPNASGDIVTTGNLTSITATGTVTSGTWNGTTIALANGGTGQTTAAAARVALLPALATNAGKVLAVNAGATDVEWITSGGGGGLTIGATTITSGTSGRVLYNNGGVVGELTGLTIATGVLRDVATTERFFATAGGSFPQFTATSYTGHGFRVATDRLDFWMSGGVVCTFDAAGINPTGNVAWSGAGSPALWGAADGTGRLVQRNSTSPQSFSIANTYTSFTNKEEFEIGWAGNLNVCKLRPIKGSGGGNSRTAEFHTTETGVHWTSGSGTPEGVVTAPIGSLYTRTDGGASTTLYVKESGTGNTGWVAK